MLAKPTDHRGLVRKIQQAIPLPIFRFLTVTYNAYLSWIPYSLKYSIGLKLRRAKAPYRFVQNGDVVVQVGMPRDVLVAGRSRAIYFALLVGKGKVVVVEPDPENARVAKAFIHKHKLHSKVILYEYGAWCQDTVLTFLLSPKHPAANVLRETFMHTSLSNIDRQVIQARRYKEVPIKVNTIDNLLKRACVPSPKLVSITTNGAELEILDGMKETIANGCSYISLASVFGDRYIKYMEKLGYQYIARDDRGFCFQALVQSDGNR